MTSCCKPCDTQPRTELSIIPVSPGSSGHFFREEIMTQHIGVKLINAFPMTRQAYTIFVDGNFLPMRTALMMAILLNIWTAENLTPIALMATLAGVRKRYSKRLTVRYQG